MKKVVLLGDSIRLLGYGKRVAEFLGEDYSVWQPEENCRFSFHTFRMIYDYREQIKDVDVIYWNNGLWDVCKTFGDEVFMDKEVYVDTMKRIAKILQANSKTVIFATTTPVRQGDCWMENKDISAYNAAVVPALEGMGVMISDLHSFVAGCIEDYVRDDDLVHLTEKGIEACAQFVAAEIQKA